MKDNNLLASVALFSELYNNEKDIYDIIAEFLKEAIKLQSKWAFTSNEAAQLLKEVFDFEIPDAVVKTTLRNRLKSAGILTFESGVYSVSSETIKNENQFTKDLEATKASHSTIFNALVEYIETRESKSFLESEKESVYRNFNSYLLDNGVNDKYSQLISSFIIENQNDIAFTTCLNIITEGLLLYTGIRYTSDLSNLGSWNTDLTIFLDTEHLFNSDGLNGKIYQDIFNDFYVLVNEINNNSKNKNGTKKIELKYFEENKNEIDAFFYVAEQIILGKENLNPSKPAMMSIVNGCKSPSDIIAKKTKFYLDLKQRGISLESKVDYYKYQELNVEDNAIFEELSKVSKENGKDINEDECRYYLKLFTKVNVLRKGLSGKGFENIGYVFVTAKSLALFLAHSYVVKFKNQDIPFATDIDFITNKFWFKLKKGFNNKNTLPKSFDIITKAQVVLSSQINNSISVEFNKLTEKYKRGEITKESAIELSYNLRERPSKPEEITISTIGESLDFLNDDNIEKHLREKSLLYKKIEEGESAQKELKKINYEKLSKSKKPIKLRIKFYYFALILLYATITFGVLSIIIYLFVKLINKVSNLTDSIADIISLGALVIFELFPIIKWKKIHRWVLKICKKMYLNKIRKLSI